MNFSELFKQSKNLCKFSPNGQYLANAVQYRLVIRDVKSLQILQLYTCLDAIQHIEWSCDSQFVLCGMYKRGLVQAWSLEQPEWTCKIDEGSAGLVNARWSPDGRHILTTSEFNIRITIWSLLNKSVSYVKHPKQCEKGLDFSSSGKYMALAERRDCKDHVSIFDCSSWHLVKHFETDTDDLAGLEWSPDGRVLCVWEDCLKYKVLLYSVDGRCLASFSAYEHMLGIKSVSWSPTNQFLAVGSYDQKARLLNHITWSQIVEYEHPPVLENNAVIVYREVVKKPALLQGETQLPAASMFSVPSKYEVEEGAVQIPVIKPDPNKANPKMGVGRLAFSRDNRYMFTRNDNMPNALWIWDIQRLKQLALLIQNSPIKVVEWDPTQPRLALCTGNNKIYMWSPAGCLSVEIPAEATFEVHSLQWHPNGNVLLLMGREQMCVCFFSEADNDAAAA